MAGLIWLASYPKSGNTWLRAFIHNLIRGGQVTYDINRLDDLVVSASSRGWYDSAHGDSTTGLSEKDVLRLRPYAHAQISRRSSDDIFVKTHSRMARLDGVDLISPRLSAGAICIVRNPLDVVVSAADHYGITIDEMIEVMADPNFRTAADAAHVSEYIGDWSGHVDSWTAVPDRRLLVLRYEDLLVAPRREFARFCAFLGLNPPPRRFENAIAASSFPVLKAHEMERGFKERAPHSKAFFRSGQSGAWRQVLSSRQADRICAHHAKVMERFGYPGPLPTTTARQTEWSEHA